MGGGLRGLGFKDLGFRGNGRAGYGIVDWDSIGRPEYRCRHYSSKVLGGK